LINNSRRGTFFEVRTSIDVLFSSGRKEGEIVGTQGDMHLLGA